MNSTTPQNTQDQQPPVDWIVVVANVLCLTVVAIAALHAGAQSGVTNVASYASVTATF
jgi:hypothetical protein